MTSKREVNGFEWTLFNILFIEKFWNKGEKKQGDEINCNRFNLIKNLRFPIQLKFRYWIIIPRFFFVLLLLSLFKLLSKNEKGKKFVDDDFLFLPCLRAMKRCNLRYCLRLGCKAFQRKINSWNFFFFSSRAWQWTECKWHRISLLLNNFWNDIWSLWNIFHSFSFSGFQGINCLSLSLFFKRMRNPEFSKPRHSSIIPFLVMNLMNNSLPVESCELLKASIKPSNCESFSDELWIFQKVNSLGKSSFLLDKSWYFCLFITSIENQFCIIDDLW